MLIQVGGVMGGLTAVAPDTTANPSYDRLLSTVAAHGLPQAAEVLPQAPLAEAAWKRLFAPVVEQRLVGRLREAASNGAFPLTPTQRDQVRRVHQQALFQTLLLEQHLLEVVGLLEEAGIDYRVLKGPAHAHALYRDPTVRVYGDIDLLLPSERFDGAIALLRRCGYERPSPEPRPGFDRRFGKGATLLDRDGLQLDLHRTLAMGPFGLTVDRDALFASATRFRLAGRELLGLGPDERFLHTCYHAALGDSPPRLVPLRDLAQQVVDGTFDEERVLALARAWSSEAVVARALTVTWDLLSLTAPAPFLTWAAARRSSRREQRALAAYVASDRTYTAKAWASLPVLPQFRDKLAFLRALALPSRDFLQAHGERRHSWLWRGGRALLRTYRRPSRA